MNTYTIKVYTDANPLLVFAHDSETLPTREHLQNAILSQCDPEWAVYYDMRNAMDYDFDLKYERSDLRDHDGQHVWAVTSLCDNDDNGIDCAEEGCNYTDYLITVEVKEI